MTNGYVYRTTSDKQNAHNRILFQSLRSLLHSRNTRYSIYCLSQPYNRTRRARTFCCLPYNPPCFQSNARTEE
jgi:hypothetical protein